MSEFVLWGFDASTYVRTIKMLLAEKHFTQFKQVPLNVLQGEPNSPLTKSGSADSLQWGASAGANQRWRWDDQARSRMT
jgi:hypothetical protein